MLHAGGSSGRQWDEVCESSPAEYRYLAPDLIGFGRTESWTGPGDLTHDGQAALVLDLITRTCDEPVHLVGHSYGGSTAVRIALTSPKHVKSLVLIEPNIMPLLADAGEHDIFDEYADVAQRFMGRAASGDVDLAWRSFIDLRNGTGAWDDMPDKVRARMLERTSQMVDGFTSNLNNATSLSDCAKLHVPVLLICGGVTTAPERRVSELLAEILPDCWYETIEGAGHMSPLTHPKSVSALLSAHLLTQKGFERRCA